MDYSSVVLRLGVLFQIWLRARKKGGIAPALGCGLGKVDCWLVRNASKTVVASVVGAIGRILFPAEDTEALAALPEFPSMLSMIAAFALTDAEGVVVGESHRDFGHHFGRDVPEVVFGKVSHTNKLLLQPVWLGGASGWATRHAPVGADGAPRLIKVERPAMAGQKRNKKPRQGGAYR